jgi:hypothetical protein
MDYDDDDDHDDNDDHYDNDDHDDHEQIMNMLVMATPIRTVFLLPSSASIFSLMNYHQHQCWVCVWEHFTSLVTLIY